LGRRLVSHDLQGGHELVSFRYRVLTAVAVQKVFFDLGRKDLRKTMKYVLFEDLLGWMEQETFSWIQHDSHNGASNKSHVSK